MPLTKKGLLHTNKVQAEKIHELKNQKKELGEEFKELKERYEKYICSTRSQAEKNHMEFKRNIEVRDSEIKYLSNRGMQLKGQLRNLRVKLRIIEDVVGIEDGEYPVPNPPMQSGRDQCNDKQR